MESQLVSEPDQRFGLSYYKVWPHPRGDLRRHGTYGTSLADYSPILGIAPTT